RILPILDENIRRKHESSRTLQDRVLWQRSFRSIVIDAEWVFKQKLEYIHSNPVKRGLCARSNDYRWSSARLWSAGLASEEGLDLVKGVQLFDVGSPPQGVAG
ncbi:MAG: hypothetical protein M3R13_01120, partial [Armatimonadota bacterium]|nr:hypothetical protein [Armatimonadota bacterium]